MCHATIQIVFGSYIPCLGFAGCSACHVLRVQFGVGGDAEQNTVEVALTFECSEVPDTPEARGQLARYKLCGFGGQGNDGGEIGLASHVVTGSCGSLTLDLFDSGGGVMQWQIIITSSLGPMINAVYGGFWNNFTGGEGFVFRDSGIIFTSEWQSNVPVFTAPGVVAAEAGEAESTLWWGLICSAAGVPFNVVIIA